MAVGSAAATLLASDQRLIPTARSHPMHPFGIYLAITDSQREYAAVDRRLSYTKVDAPPLTEVEPQPVSRRTRLVATLRRHVMRTAGA